MLGAALNYATIVGVKSAVTTSGCTRKYRKGRPVAKLFIVFKDTLDEKKYEEYLWAKTAWGLQIDLGNKRYITYPWSSIQYIEEKYD